MRKNKLKTFLLAVIGISSFACVTLHAQNVTEPKMTLYDFKDQSKPYRRLALHQRPTYKR